MTLAADDFVRSSVNQPPAGGTDFPFVGQDQLGWVFLDVYLSYKDDTCRFSSPFHLKVNPTTSSPVQFHIQIVDAFNQQVFDGAAQLVSAWGSDRSICASTTTTGTFRAVVRNARFAELPVGSWTTSVRDLDPRTYHRLPRRVGQIISQTINPPAIYNLDGNIVFSAGHNQIITVENVASAEGKRIETRIIFDGVPGAGLGRVPGCAGASQPIRTINGVKPDASGNFTLQFTDCYREQRKTWIDYSSGAVYQNTNVNPQNYHIGESNYADFRARAAHDFPVARFYPDQISPLDTDEIVSGVYPRHSIQMVDDCVPCSQPVQYENTYMGVKAVWQDWKNLSDQLSAVRAQFVKNMQRWNVAQECLKQNSLRLLVVPEPLSRVFAGASFCNNTDKCLRNPEIRFTFSRYANGALAGAPAKFSIKEAYLAFGSRPEKEIALTGAWPSFYTTIDALNPQDSFALRLRTCSEYTAGDTIRVAASLHYADGALGGTQTPPIGAPAGSTSSLPARYSAEAAAEVNTTKAPFACGCD